MTYEYDTQAGGLMSYANVVQHDAARDGGFAYRGNVTKESRIWAESPDGSAAETTAGYDIAGNRVWVTTPKDSARAERNSSRVPIAVLDYHLDLPSDVVEMLRSRFFLHF